MTTNALMELAACPFCGVTPWINSNRDWHHLNADHLESCHLYGDGHVRVPATDEQYAALVEAWNTRTPATQLRTAAAEGEKNERPD